MSQQEDDCVEVFWKSTVEPLRNPFKVLSEGLKSHDSGKKSEIISRIPDSSVNYYSSEKLLKYRERKTC